MHFYNSTSVLHARGRVPQRREGNQSRSRSRVHACAARSSRWCPGTEVFYEYSTESYTGTELRSNGAVEVCNARAPRCSKRPPERKVNQITTARESRWRAPNVYADSIEWMNRHSPTARNVLLSLQTRTTIAARPSPGPRRARLPGARPPHRRAACSATASAPATVDLVSLGINLFTQGIDPQLSTSRPLTRSKRTARVMQIKLTRARALRLGGRPRLPRPSAGSHTRTPSSKGFESDGCPRRQGPRASASMILHWAVPTCTSKPPERIWVARTKAVIRVNIAVRQGRVAYLLKTTTSSTAPQALADRVQPRRGRPRPRLTAGRSRKRFRIWEIFQDEYLPAAEADAKWARFELLSTRTAPT